MQKSFKKALALVLSFMLSVTCFAVVPFSALAAATVTPDAKVTGTAPTVTANYDTQLRFTEFTSDEFMSRKANNLIKKASLTAYKSNGTVCPDVNSNNGIACLTDGWICEDNVQCGDVPGEGITAPDGAVKTDGKSGTYGDGKYSGKYYAYQGFNVTTGEVDGATLEIGLAKPTEISNLYLMGTQKTNGVFQAYKVYVSDRKSTLYDEKNLVLDYNANGAPKMNAEGVSEGQEFIFTGDNKPTGTFIGFKITSLCPIVEDFFYLCELGVEGTEGESNVTVNDNKANVWSAYKVSGEFGEATSHTYFNDVKANNLLASASTTADFKVWNTNTNSWSTKDAGGNETSISKQGILYDGSVEQPDSPGGTGARWRVYSAQPTRVTLDFGAAYEFSKIYFSLVKGYPLSSYSFYVSDDVNTLYNAENEILAYAYSGRSTTAGDIVDSYTYTGETKPIGRYIGIAAAGASNTMYTEIGVEGVYKYAVDAPAKDVDIDYISDKMHYVDVASGAEFNLDDKIGIDADKQPLAGKNVMKDVVSIGHNAYYPNGTRKNYGTATTQQVTDLTDGKLGNNGEKYNPSGIFGDKLNADSCKDWGSGFYSWVERGVCATEIVIELKDTTDIKAIAIGSSSTNPIGDHDIFISDSKDTLFSGDPVAQYVMDYDKWIASRDGNHPASALGVNVWKTNKDASIVGKYVGIRIWIGDAIAKTNSGLAQYYFDRLRLNEFAVYGDAIIPYAPTFNCPTTLRTVKVSGGAAGKPYSFKIEEVNDEKMVDTVKIAGVDLIPDENGVYTITDTTAPVTVDITDKDKPYVPADPAYTNKVTLATDKTWTQSNRSNITYVENKLSAGTHSVDEVMGNDLNGNAYSSQNLTQGKALPFNYHNYNVANHTYGSVTNAKLNDNTEANNGIVNNTSANFDIVTAPRIDANSVWPETYPETGKMYTGIQDRHQPTELILDLGQKSDISGILLASNSTAPVGEYELYVGDTYGNIFDTEPVASVTYTNVEKYFAPTGRVANPNASIQIWKTTKGQHIYGRYVAFKVYQVGMTGPNSYGGYFDRIRLCELAVFGQAVPATTKGVEYSVVNEGNLIVNDGMTDMLSAPEATFKTPFYKDPTSGTVTEATATSFDDVTIPYKSDSAPNWKAARDRSTGDGNAKNFVGAPAATFFDADGHKVIGSDYYTDFTFNLRPAYIKRIQLAGANAKPEMQIGHFALYVADDKAELYDDANLVVDFDNTQMGDGYKTTAQISTVEFDYGALKGKYIGLRIYDPTQGRVKGATYDTNYGYAMFRELNVVGYFGDEADENVIRTRFSGANIDAYKEVMGDLSDNVLYGKSPECAALLDNPLKSSEGEVTTSGITGGDLSGVTTSDGILNSSRFGQGTFEPVYTVKVGDDNIHAGYIDDEDKQYYDVAFEMDAVTAINNFAFLSQNSFAAISHYKFSVANDIEDAFTEDANYNSPEYFNDNGAVKHEFTQPVIGRFIVLRIICSEYFGGMIGDFGDAINLTQHYIRLTHVYVNGTYEGGMTADEAKDSVTLDSNCGEALEYVTKEYIPDVNMNADSEGNYVPGSGQVKLTLTKTEFEDDAYNYSFIEYSEWTADTEVTVHLGAEVYLDFDAEAKSTDFTVKFLDKMGNPIFETTVEEGATLAPEQIAEAELKVPEIFGYTKSLDENGAQLWNNDVTAPIVADTTFKALYVKSGDTYAVNFDYETNGYKYTQNKKFNDLVICNTYGATGAYVGDTLIAGVSYYNSKEVFQFYVSGNMDVTFKQKTESNPFVGFVGNGTKGNDNNGNSYTVFAHFENIALEDIAEIGVNFTSKTQYNNLATTDEDWRTAIGGSAVKTAVIPQVSNDFMATLSSISTTKAVTRYAQAFVTLKNGTTYVTESPIFGAFNYAE